MAATVKSKKPSKRRWYMPGSVLNALWGNIMPRLAAPVWTGELEWPPKKTSLQKLHGGLVAVPLNAKAMKEFADQLVKMAFRRYPNDTWEEIQDNYKHGASGLHALTNGQRATLVTTEYFHPGAAAKHLDDRPRAPNRMRVRVVKAESYDLVLSDRGLDVFVPPTPGGLNGKPPITGKKEVKKALQDVLRHYKFRETGKPPIGLPGAPATAFPGKGPKGGSKVAADSFISIPQLTAPTGAHQIPEGWMTAMANKVDWWLSGSLYRGIMAAFPRVVASMWYEEVTWGTPKQHSTAHRKKTYRWRFEHGGLKEMLQERVETILPDDLEIHVDKEPKWLPKHKEGWNPRDIMITSDGLYFPDPGPAPAWKDLMKAIEIGIAGNPIFTDTGPCIK